MNHPFFDLISVLFLLGGCYYAIKAMCLFRDQMRARAWRHASGQVLEAGVAERVVGTGRIGTSRVFMPRVVYEYAVGGHRYVSQVLDRAGWLLPNRRRAERLAARFKPGARVAVYYDPRLPARACLLRRPIAALPYALGSICLFVLGLLNWLVP